MLFSRGVYNDAPFPRTKDQEVPTLLYSWWCTIFAAVIILVRLSGRLVRNDMLFREDKIMFASIIPLLVRMAFIHVVLIWGTNNADLENVTDPTDLHHREIGSRLVLAARVFYAMFIWTAKFTVLGFLKRMTDRFWRRSFELGMRFITWYLIASFIAVVLSTILECRPIHNYWQVEPYHKCTQAFAQLITMAAADITSDLLIVIFPIPVIWASGIPLKRKISLILLFSTNIIMVAITANRVPAVIRHHGSQQYRTVWASSEILAATIVSNAVVIGSFLRDRGIKKAKYRTGSQTDSMDKRSIRRPTVVSNAQWGSDEHLAADLGYRLDPELCERPSLRPAGIVQPLPNSGNGAGHYRKDSDMLPITSRDWQFPAEHAESSRASEESTFKSQKPRNGVVESPQIDEPLPSPRTIMHPKSNTSFFDIGGLLDNSPERSRRSSATVVAGLTPTQSHVLSQSDGEASRSRRGSRALLSDIGGLMLPARGLRQHDSNYQSGLQEIEEHEMQPPSSSRLALPSKKSSKSKSRSRSRSPHPAMSIASKSSHPPSGIQTPVIAPHPERQNTLQDVGGLLPLDYTKSFGLKDPGGLLSADPQSAQSQDPNRLREASNITEADPQILHDAGGLLVSDTHNTTTTTSAYFTPSHATPPASQTPTPQPPRPSTRQDADSPDTGETLVASSSSASASASRPMSPNFSRPQAYRSRSNRSDAAQ